MRRILWFRRDLRVKDNPLLSLGGEVLPIFIFDPNILNSLPKEDKRVGFIIHHVKELRKSLQEMGLDLHIFYEKPIEVFNFLNTFGFDEVAASGDYDEYAKNRDRDISHILPFNFIDDTYIFSPKEILKSDGSPYLVFTPFYNSAKNNFKALHLREYMPAKMKLFPFRSNFDFEEFPYFSKLSKEILDPKLVLDSFDLDRYQSLKEIMSIRGTSRLGAHLRFGTIGIRELLRYLAKQKKSGLLTEPFFRQLVFRDFYAYLLYHFPYLSSQNFRHPFKGIPNEFLHSIFIKAKTGVPIVDAGIKELLETGFMHNRVRMICASFYTKHLLLPWQWGASFFAKYLLDFDEASNALSWQWSAGTGVDPQPYFRIFNPYAQSAKFDKDGIYIKQFLPNLKNIEAKILHDEEALFAQNLEDYPKPIVVHKESRERALAYFKGAIRKI